MKSFKLIPVGAALAWFVASAAPAFAVTVSPAGPFSLTGSTTLMKNGLPVACTAAMAGTITSSGAVEITSGRFSGNSLCSLVTPTGFPWKGQVNSTTGLTLNGVAVDTTLGNCGPSTINTSIIENTQQRETLIGMSSQVLSGNCSVSGSLSTTPFLTVQ